MLRKLSASGMDWKLINFRTVSNLITAEFLHDLYNRHSYEVNSIRFRNTLCVLNGNDFRSYAPQKEWEQLEMELGERFYDRDPILLSELSLYMEKDKHRLKEYLSLIPNDLDLFSSKEVYQILVHLHFLALGEIYGINLVQIEHAISWAISQYLKGNTKDFSYLPTFQWESEQRKMEKALLESSIKISEKSECFDLTFAAILEEYGDFGNAYGTGMDFVEELKTQLLELVCQSLKERKMRLLSYLTSAQVPVNESYRDLYEIASEVGKLRDRNKLLMGRVSGVRSILLEALSKTLEIQREDLNWYSLSEIGELIRHHQVLLQDEIFERKKLIIFKREEGFACGIPSEGMHRMLLGDLKSSKIKGSQFTGVIAAKGKIIGKARLVYTANDCNLIEPGEIMIAHGTDFDLLSGISKSAGIVTEEGGILSHASIVSRELQKPCLINVIGAMSSINNGDRLQLDCETGTLTIIEEAKETNLSLIEPLDDIDPTTYSSKIAQLSNIKKKGYRVFDGLCIPSLSHVLNESFFESLKNKIRNDLKTDKVIIRQCHAWEDQKERSFAGASCSRVSSTDLYSLAKTFQDVVNTPPKMKVTSSKADLLIQPYISFECGGVIFIQTDPFGHQNAIVEISEQGPFDAVNGKPTHRFSFSLSDVLETLSLPYLKEAIEMGRNIFDEMGFDVDIEWGVYDQKIWILQVRPVTVTCAL